MRKRGQVTTFIIVGIIAVIAILLVFFLRNTLFGAIAGADRINSYLQGQMESISKEIKKCVDDNTKKNLDLLGKQGGFFEPQNYLNYYGNKISYLCLDILDDKRCSNVMLTKEAIEKQIDERLEAELKNCIDLESFNIAKLYDYELIYDMNSLDVVSEINLKNVLVNVSLPVKVKKDEFEISKNDFISSVNLPIGEVLGITNDIVNSEASIGDFNTLSYDLFSFNKYLVKKYRPFGNRLYTIQIRGYDYLFQFAVESK